MKISELLLEYRRDITQQKLAKELGIIANNEHTTPEDVLVQVEAIDPTKNKQYVLWLVKQLVKKQFRLEDAHRVTELLKNFISVKNRLPLDQRDIGRFDFYKLDDLIDKTMNVELEKDTATSNGTFPVVPNSKVLYNGPLGQLAIPETEEASCELGRGTKWCTAAEKDNYFSEYNMHGPLFVWRDKSGEKYQFHFETHQFKDSKDRPIDGRVLQHFRTTHPVISKLFAKHETGLLKTRDPARLVTYAERGIKGRWPEAEPIILKDTYAAVGYAEDIIGGRWPEAEPVILQDVDAAVGYAEDIIGGRWPEAEPVILQDVDAAVDYATVVIGGRWPEAEDAISENPGAALRYALEVIQGRWPEVEDEIAANSDEIESYDLMLYASGCLHKRWPEVEARIKNDRESWMQYVTEFPDAAHV